MFGIDGGVLIGAIIIVLICIIFLKGFDKIAGRGPKQIKDGINRSNITKDAEFRISCPYCSEKILPSAKKCPFCKTDLK